MVLGGVGRALASDEADGSAVAVICLEPQPLDLAVEFGEREPYRLERHHQRSAFRCLVDRRLENVIDGPKEQRLIADAPRVLRPGGWLLLELGYNSLESVRGMLSTGWGEIAVEQDLAGLPRVLAARLML